MHHGRMHRGRRKIRRTGVAPAEKEEKKKKKRKERNEKKIAKERNGTGHNGAVTFAARFSAPRRGEIHIA